MRGHNGGDKTESATIVQTSQYLSYDGDDDAKYIASVRTSRRPFALQALLNRRSCIMGWWRGCVWTRKTSSCSDAERPFCLRPGVIAVLRRNSRFCSSGDRLGKLASGAE